MALATRAIHLRYNSAERFHRDYNQLRKGSIFLPAKNLLPNKTKLTLNISLPEIDKVFAVDGAVISTIDRQAAEKLKKPSGMLVAILGGPDAIMTDLNSALRSNEKYRDMLGLADPAKASVLPPGEEAVEALSDDEQFPEDFSAQEGGADLTLEWLREAVAQEKATKEEAAPEVASPAVGEKKNLTTLEREKVRPSGEFLMDLTKAMLRSGYYSSDHPGAANAKRGLYARFQKCLRDSSEMMVTHQETRQKSDILITGILDEPVNVRQLVGAGQAELFIPKLREYFHRKGLVSFAIKKRITPEHFEGFVDIMSDPKADRGENSKVGELLSNALIEHGISEISAVFMDDMIALELNLPWRVEMAIQRLAKDLKVLPMFRDESDEAIRGMKLQIIQDIIRPLRHPEFLKDLIINCYIIAKHVETIKAEDIEKVIIEAFPLDTLLPTSRFIFEELNELRQINAENPDNAALLRRFAGVKRILKWVSRRLVLADIRGAQGFLERLFLNEVLTFEELPPDVQYLINTAKIAGDVQAHSLSYMNRILHADSTENAAVLLKCFRRIIPVFMEQKDWRTAFLITKAVTKAGGANKLFTEGSRLPPKPQKFIFKDRTDDLFEAYVKADDSKRRLIGKIAGKLGTQGFEILSRVLSDCDDRAARKEATDFLIKKGDMARHWVLKVLADPKRPWYLHRNALMILRYVARQEAEIDKARKFVSHTHPRIRDEALNTIIALKAGDTEQLVIAALDDPDDKVRWRATSALNDLSSLTAASVEKILAIIRAESPEEKEEAARHARKVSQLIRAVGTLENLTNHAQMEDTILDVAQKLSAQKKGLFQRFKKSEETDQAPILSATVATLAKIGTPKSEEFLTKLAGSKTSQAESARSALDSIRLRYAKQQAAVPAGV
jgi:nucleoside diphosphate kinase